MIVYYIIIISKTSYNKKKKKSLLTVYFKNVIKCFILFQVFKCFELLNSSNLNKITNHCPPITPGL